MLRKMVPICTTLLATVALAAIAPSRASADTLQYARNSGALSLDQGATGITVYVAAYKYTRTLYPTSPQYSGSVNIAGASGGLRITIGASVQRVEFAKTATGYKQAKVTTKPFYYTDQNTGVRCLAYAIVRATQCPLRGTAAFAVLQYGTNQVLCTSGNEIGLWTGSTFIYF